MEVKLTDSLPWVEKYRPSKLEDLVSQGDIIDTISNFIEANKLPHLLFYGPPGTGKTSTILAIAKKIYKSNLTNVVLELNASDDRGIDVVRERIKEFASSKNLFNNEFKLIILDEADAMTNAAQAALRRIIEKYTNNVRFCIICNYVSKIIPALQSRCTKFRFAPLESEQIEARLNAIALQENVNITDNGKTALLKISNGDMRRVLNILQACHSAFDLITEKEVYLCTGLPLPEEIEKIRDWLMNAEFSLAYNNINSLKIERGLALQDIIDQLYLNVLELKLPTNFLGYLMSKLANIEYNLSIGASEEIQLTNLVSIFKIGIELIVQ
ncbi:hypothetical protein K502DRAFT_336753 [Neoconidiobolus thromboides FSU 785]|nr:hypothetical protein K502DRAFT_336753 [Neoconidiobolus thromboides FSU 785]